MNSSSISIKGDFFVTPIYFYVMFWRKKYIIIISIIINVYMLIYNTAVQKFGIVRF